MKVKPEQLAHSLSQNTFPFYLVGGDEPLLVQESCNLIRQHCYKLGYREKIIFHLEPSFDWINFFNVVSNQSLFADKTLIELRLKNKLNETGNKAMQRYAEHPSAHSVVLIVTNKLDASQQKSTWYKSIDRQGIIVQIWQPNISQFQQWIIQKLKIAGLIVTNETLQFLADHWAGNLLAASQEIDKLLILHGPGEITGKQVEWAIMDSARFNVVNLMEACMAGNLDAIHRILDYLKKEQMEPSIILWQIANELRTMIKIKISLMEGTSMESAMAANHVFFNKKIPLKKIITKFSLESLLHLLGQTAKIELLIKGANDHHLLWHELKKIYGSFCFPNALH